MKTNVDHNFFYRIRSAVGTMREAGINETLIGIIVQDIRSATLQEEFNRLRNLITDSPPKHDTCFDMAYDIKEQISEEKS